mgnify:CR=1 FL=1
MLREFLADFAQSSSELRIVEETVIENYLWRSKDEKVRIPKVMLFVVENVNGNRHNVVLAKKDGKFYIWCGDIYIRELGFKENYCIAWKNKNTKCKHCQHVAYSILNSNSVDSLEKFFDGESSLTTEKKKEKEKHLKELELGWKFKMPVLLYGITGSGKTHSVLSFVRELQEKEDVGFYQINMSSGMEDVDLLAKLIPDTTTGKWQIIDGELTKAFKEAQEKQVVILIEELTRSSKSSRNLLLKCMDAVAGHYELQNFVTGERIKVPVDNVWWIATANIGYSDTEGLDPALARRFQLTKFISYNVVKEREIVNEILGDEKETEKVMKMVEVLRKAYTSGSIAYPIDTGTLKTFCVILKELKDPLISAETTFTYRIVDVDNFGMPSEEQVNLIKDVIKSIWK